MPTVMETNSTKLSLRQPLIFLGTFVLIVAILIGILSIADRAHKEDIYNRYANETNSYINNNKQALVQLFTEVFPNTPTCQQYNPTSPCQIEDGSKISKLLPSTLKDWSSTFFIKQVSANKILSMRLSGEVQELQIYPQDKGVLVEELLSGQIESIPWDRYSYLLSTKEVIIPVKDTNNKVIGAIVRGTIE